MKSARNAGYEPIGDPRRKPKHFAVLGRRDNKLTELHIELDGHIRKMKDVAADDQKWRDAGSNRTVAAGARIGRNFSVES